MKRTPITATAAAVVIAVIASIAHAQQKIDLGKREYESRCAVCHGASGRGDGPYAGVIDSKIANLATLSKQNGGVFPFARVYESIDGTAAIRAHGTRDMPIWGTVYRISAGEYYGEMPYDPEAFVRGRILALAEYIARLQAK